MTLPLLNSNGEIDLKKDPVPQAYSKIEVDRDLCIGAESCVVVAPEVFAMDDENIAIIIDEKGTDAETILRAAQACPVAAILLYDEDGKQVYP
jgi:ferredoxin